MVVEVHSKALICPDILLLFGSNMKTAWKGGGVLKTLFNIVEDLFFFFFFYFDVCDV